MKILAVQPRIGSGGQQNAMMGLCHGLAELGHEVWLCGELQYVNPMWLSPDLRYLPIRLSRLRPWQLNVVTRRNWYTLDQLHKRERFDAALHLHDASLPLASIAESRWGIPAVVCVFGLSASHQGKWFQGAFLANSEYTAGWLAERVGRRPEEIPHIIAPTNFEPFFVSPQAERGSRGRHRTIGVVGRLARGRIEDKMASVRHAIEAVDQLLGRGRSCDILVAGDGPAREEAEVLATRLNQRHGRRVIRLCGHVRDMPRFYGEVDAVVAIAGCALEAMASGRPAFVVGPRGFAGCVEPSTVSELEKDVFCGVRPTPCHPEGDLAGSLERVLWNPDLYRRLSQWGRRHVQEHYGMTKAAQSAEAVIEARRTSLADSRSSEAGCRQLRRASKRISISFLARAAAGFLLTPRTVLLEHNLARARMASSVTMFGPALEAEIRPLEEYTLATGAAAAAERPPIDEGRPSR